MKLPHVLAASLCLVALLHARSLTHGLTWPAFNVQFREMAGAQALLDGDGGVDPCYRGESAWYNPMTGWVLAALSRVVSAPLPSLTVSLGPWLNLIAPIGFYLLVAALLEPWTALAALAAFLFLAPIGFPFYDAASYSPWLAPESWGQGIFYLALLALHREERNGASASSALVNGVLLGLVFLVHTSPAIVLGAVVVAVTAARIATAGSARPALARLAVVLGAALLTSAPVVASVVGRYGLRTVNRFPSQSPNPLFGSIRALSTALLIRTPIAVAVLAFGWRLARRPASVPRVLKAWIVVSVAFLAWVGGVVAARRSGAAWFPAPPVPLFHFLFSTMALVSIGFGIVVTDVASWVSARMERMGRAVAPEAIVAGALAVVLAVAAPFYLRRPDAAEVLDEARTIQEVMPGDLYRWMRESARPDDVVLCTDAESLFVVAPAGRKVVATNRYFSNPFVDWEARDRDRNAMMDALHAGNVRAYDALAARYDVRFIVVADGLNDDFRKLAGISLPRVPALIPADLEGRPGFERVYRDARYSVFRRDLRGGPSRSSSAPRGEGERPARLP